MKVNNILCNQIKNHFYTFGLQNYYHLMQNIKCSLLKLVSAIRVFEPSFKEKKPAYCKNHITEDRRAWLGKNFSFTLFFRPCFFRLPFASQFTESFAGNTFTSYGGVKTDIAEFFASKPKQFYYYGLISL